ncbi:MAG: hypothetical protein AVDCRST_MAG49-3519 [uncultured Thermomicrobiales bacterium]|uniref:Uncharacterized protein n=1 Tax=uncultured Thermomicrobiales bacterium TaxID=1645740 RepID=A0A6J4V5K7_9BACT|nr:MAG: hypothetical protein AVDCRST_MAG49-3519 [uncultured Thermomicrobiales bacterium]
MLHSGGPARTAVGPTESRILVVLRRVPLPSVGADAEDLMVRLA